MQITAECAIVNLVCSSSTLPDAWKEALITPIFKKGDRSITNDYRPISLTFPIVKLMESIIKDKVLEYMIKK